MSLYEVTGIAAAARSRSFVNTLQLSDDDDELNGGRDTRMVNDLYA